MAYETIERIENTVTERNLKKKSLSSPTGLAGRSQLGLSASGNHQEPATSKHHTPHSA